MDALTAWAVLLAGGAAALAVGPSRGATRLRALGRAGRKSLANQRPGERRTDDDRLPTRSRVLAAGLAGCGGWGLVGGLAGFVAGAVAFVVAWRLLGRLEPATVARRRHEVSAALPLAADLVAAAVAAGSPPGVAAGVVGRAVGGPLGERLAAAAAAAQVGAEPAVAWAPLLADETTRPFARAVVSATDRGSGPVPLLERAAQDARDATRWAAEARARSLGARAAAPLGLCFLPAFVLVGIVPLIATVAMPLLG